jgi:hypothetical protein
MARRKSSKKDLRQRTAELKAACVHYQLDARGGCASLEKRLRIYLQDVEDAQTAFMERTETNITLPLVPTKWTDGYFEPKGAENSG